ncbi:MAG TPA: hypothetical protein PKJ62_07855 [Bacteroidia bacterium]|nr:hypothetical protein [Bacteroidia bacterium]HNS13336.1 hypothetical protein [Bacteroidia bacterium]
MILRKIFALLLISSLLFPPVLKLGVIADFYQHKDFIASTLCINKNKPLKKCGGNCHLSKQLAKAQEKGADNNAPVPTLKTELSPTVLFESPQFFFDAVQLKSYSVFSESEYFLLSSIDFFHPPQA